MYDHMEAFISLVKMAWFISYTKLSILLEMMVLEHFVVMQNT